MAETDAVDGIARAEALAPVFGALRTDNPDIVGVALLSADGELLAAQLPPELEDGLVQGLATSLASIAETTAIELTMGPPEFTVVRGPAGYTVLVPVNGRNILLVLTGIEARLGLVLLDARRAVGAIANLT